MDNHARKNRDQKIMRDKESQINYIRQHYQSQTQTNSRAKDYYTSRHLVPPRLPRVLLEVIPFPVPDREGWEKGNPRQIGQPLRPGERSIQYDTVRWKYQVLLPHTRITLSLPALPYLPPSWLSVSDQVTGCDFSILQLLFFFPSSPSLLLPPPLIFPAGAAVFANPHGATRTAVLPR